jgi:hypothetical protein
MKAKYARTSPSPITIEQATAIVILCARNERASRRTIFTIPIIHARLIMVPPVKLDLGRNFIASFYLPGRAARLRALARSALHAILQNPSKTPAKKF